MSISLSTWFIFMHVLVTSAALSSFTPFGHFSWASNRASHRVLHKCLSSSRSTELKTCNEGGKQQALKLSLGQATSTIHLVSIPTSSDDCPKIVREIWKWKDVVLGDGRDYFVPRPRALKALSDLLIGSTCGNYVIKECTVISNCARMEILLSVDHDISASHESDYYDESHGDHLQLSAGDAAKKIVAECLCAQLESFQAQQLVRGAFMENVSSFFDLPGMVDESLAISIYDECSYSSRESRELASSIIEKAELNQIILHFCMVAAGLAPRTSRPDRPVVFRPFSSRDAHIMLQLKRTCEVASQYPKLKIILDAALSAGKAARDPKQCPELEKLRGYDGEGKYSQAAPPQLAKKVAEKVIEVAIEPQVQRGIERMNAFECSDKISALRQRAFNLCNESDRDNEKLVRKMLHEPCMDLRKGKHVNAEEVLEQIRRKIS